MIYLTLEKIFKSVFKDLNLGDFGKVELSKRPELCDYQCNDVFVAARANGMKPQELGEKVVEAINKLDNFSDNFNEVTFAMPGFINIKIGDKLLNDILNQMVNDKDLGIIKDEQPLTFVLDYGGPNIAKPLHVGHFRTAVIGEAMKKIIEAKGHKTIADVHLGDFGLQIGQVILGVKDEQPELVYFDESYDGEYPEDAPFTIKDLERIYPAWSKKCKEDKEILDLARTTTMEFQKGRRGYVALWRHIMEVSIPDIKRLYKLLSINFDYWYGESDGSKYIPQVEAFMESKKVLKKDQGAVIIDVAKEDDKHTVPPLIFENSNGSHGYAATDLGTIYQRVEDFNPDNILYFTDTRQWNHFNQVFRASHLSKLVKDNVSLEHIGYGTINGEDNKPFKTRSGDAVSLDLLLNMVNEKVLEIREENRNMSDEDRLKLVNSILKFGDLQNSIEKNYIFDLDKFSSFTGKTGPYILYTVLRIKNLFGKIDCELNQLSETIYNEDERKLRLKLLEFNKTVDAAYKERAPHFIAEYVYSLSALANSFYQAHHLVSEEDKAKQQSWASLLNLSIEIIEKLLGLLTIEVPESM